MPTKAQLQDRVDELEAQLAEAPAPAELAQVDVVYDNGFGQALYKARLRLLSHPDRREVQPVVDAVDQVADIAVAVGLNLSGF